MAKNQKAEIKPFKSESEYREAKRRCNAWERAWRAKHEKQHRENSKWLISRITAPKTDKPTKQSKPAPAPATDKPAKPKASPKLKRLAQKAVPEQPKPTEPAPESKPTETTV